MLLVAVVDQGVEPVDAVDDHVATTTAIAAIGAAEFDEFLAQETDRAGATIAGTDIDLGLVEKFHELTATCLGWVKRAVRSSQRARVSSVSIWLTSSLRARQSL